MFLYTVGPGRERSCTQDKELRTTSHSGKECLIQVSVRDDLVSLAALRQLFPRQASGKISVVTV